MFQLTEKSFFFLRLISLNLEPDSHAAVFNLQVSQPVDMRQRGRLIDPLMGLFDFRKQLFFLAQQTSQAALKN